MSALSTVVVVGGIVRGVIAIILKDKKLPLPFNMLIFFVSLSVIGQATKLISVVSGVSFIFILKSIPDKIKGVGGQIKEKWEKG